MPDRIRQYRGKPLPSGAKSVARPSKYGNPFKVGGLYAEPDQPVRVPPLPRSDLAGLTLAEGARIAWEISGINWVYTVRRVRDRAHAVALFIAWAPFQRDEKTGLPLPQLARRDLAGYDLACYCPLDDGPCHAGNALIRWAAGLRARTPDLVEGRVTTIKVKRCCNGCGQQIGDVTDKEIAASVSGQQLPDVRAECPRCAQGNALTGEGRHDESR